MEKVIIVGVSQEKNKQDFNDSMDELEELVKASGGHVVYRVTQNRTKIEPKTFIGIGKAYEILDLSKEYDAETIIFNDELSGSQMRNLEEIINKKILDRSSLILDIFATRASTKESKLQVKLAQLQYRLPRLVGYSNHLSRLGGGIGTRGPGEQKLEIDRRVIQRDITNIKKQLKEASKNRDINRQQRLRSDLPIVSLVGYTNAGKSTLMNQILKNNKASDDKQVFEKDMLFATLNTSLRTAQFSNQQPFLLTDTVGFVSKLPTFLVESFKSTLEEITYSDLILIVVDASNSNLELQLNTTHQIIKELKSQDIPTLTVFNKMDKVTDEQRLKLMPYFKDTYFMSALNPQDVTNLLDTMQVLLSQENDCAIIRE